jgi:hypothetical protein
MVRLKALSKTCIAAFNSHYNSSMVRLKVEVDGTMYAAGLFQFLNGAIKS